MYDESPPLKSNARSYIRCLHPYEVIPTPTTPYAVPLPFKSDGNPFPMSHHPSKAIPTPHKGPCTYDVRKILGDL